MHTENSDGWKYKEHGTRGSPKQNGRQPSIESHIWDIGPSLKAFFFQSAGERRPEIGNRTPRDDGHEPVPRTPASK